MKLDIETPNSPSSNANTRAVLPLNGRISRCEPLNRFSWDDLRIITAIGMGGCPSAAATLLGVNISTISRRLSHIEAALGVPMFDRRRSGYLPTDEGAELIALGERVEFDIVSMVRRISTVDQGCTGTLRITTSDSLLLHFLTPIIADFSAANTAIRIEVLVGNCALNLARGEADIAVRATEHPPENLVGRKVAAIAWAPYGCRSDLSGELPCADRLSDRKWVSYTAELSSLKAFHYVEEHVAAENIAYRTDSVSGVCAAITAGLGVGFLPCMLGDLMEDLVRAGPPLPDLKDDLWLLTHPDVRKAGRVQAFMAFCAAAISSQRAFIEGHAQPSPTAPAMSTGGSGGRAYVN